MEFLNFSILLWVIIIAVQAMIMMAACAWLAGQRGRDKITWGCLGLLLGFLALILLAVSPKKE